jgi:hypothetical protein
MGFMQLLPSTWHTEAAVAPGGPRDPCRPFDAMVAAGSYLHRIEVGAGVGGQHDPSAALAVYGCSAACAGQVLALAEPATTSTLPVALPIPVPGWVQRIQTPAWPADLAARMSPSAMTNQRVAGALASTAAISLWRERTPTVSVSRVMRFTSSARARSSAPDAARAAIMAVLHPARSSDGMGETCSDFDHRSGWPSRSRVSSSSPSC